MLLCLGRAAFSISACVEKQKTTYNYSVTIKQKQENKLNEEGLSVFVCMNVYVAEISWLF